ncbi:MAG: hypothetical protein FJX53_09170 [Alphaproteobacteria bacterium]|nr:hypothetical protein [Alphaproteobacteria bacterium]
MIRSFADRQTERLFAGFAVRRWRPIERVARRWLDLLDRATRLDDLRLNPGNRLEKLRGDRAGSWSIRINDQYQICFDWQQDGPHDVEIVDYH